MLLGVYADLELEIKVAIVTKRSRNLEEIWSQSERDSGSEWSST